MTIQIVQVYKERVSAAEREWKIADGKKNSAAALSS